MREQYWRMYTDIKHRAVYYKHFYSLFNFINWMLSGFCTVASFSSIAAWSIWGAHPVLWSLIICSAQILQALFPKLPYTDLLISTKFMISSLDKLLLEIKHTWLEINYVQNLPDESILILIKKYETLYSGLVSQFFSGTFLPEIKYISKKSEKECKIFFKTNFTSNEEV